MNTLEKLRQHPAASRIPSYIRINRCVVMVLYGCYGCYHHVSTPLFNFNQNRHLSFFQWYLLVPKYNQTMK